MAHIVVLSVAMLALLFLPCVAAAVFCADEAGPRRLRSLREARELRRVDRALLAADPVPALLGTPSLEQLAVDLRRLSQERRGGLSRHSEKWQAAVLLAYDQRLCLACRALGLTEHLEGLRGMDRDLERLRVESSLQAAGLALL